MNQSYVDNIYSMYMKKNQDTETKAHNAIYVGLVDCIQLLKVDTRLNVPKRMIRQAFAMCKMTVEKEHDSEGQLDYLKLSRVEFLEFIARIAELFFAESEMEELPLSEKVEHVLDEILPVIGAKRTKQQITIEEFSDSDDDY